MARRWRLPPSFRLVANRPRQAFRVELDTRAIALPPACANCGQIAGEAHRLTRSGRSLLVPYCGPCGAQLARVVTTNLAATLASAILVVTGLTTLPRLFSDLTRPAMALAVFALGAFPLLAASALRQRFDPPRSSSGRAVHWASRSAVVCFNSAWAAQLAASASSVAEPCRAAEHSVSPWSWLVSALAVVATPSVHEWSFPKLVVLNFGQSAVYVERDGDGGFEVEPTSLESPRAGQRLRVASGQHHFTVTDARGAPLESHAVYLEAGQAHLLAIAASGYCFWLEYDSYGKQAPAQRRVVPLRRSAGSGDGAFWVLPAPVDTWFAPNPTPAQDERSTGGTMVALRHAPCADVPTELGSGFDRR